MIVLVTGGAGYIGSHAVQRLLRDDHRVIAVDNLDRGHIQAIHALTAIAQGHLSFVQADIAETKTLTQVMRARKVDAVMHFAALAYVGESVDEPLRYYRNNTAGALSVLQAVDAAGVKRFVFSSTCATYGKPKPRYIPIPETCPQAPINPYGRSKLQVEQMLFDYAASAERAGKSFSFAALRYFNVAGSDRTGVLGEHHDPETHLIPIILQAMLGLRENVTIFGTNYDTPDGTCIRDYVHVEDLIDAHVAVLDALEPGDTRAYNLGIGKGYSVRQVINAAKRVTGRKIEIVQGPRRAGDPPRLFADPAKIKSELKWTAKIRNIDEIIASAWDWFEKHPRGYETRAGVTSAT